MSETPRILYLLTYRAIDGSLRRSWFGSKTEALKAASNLKVDFEIEEAYI